MRERIKKNSSIFESFFQLFPTGLLVVDSEQIIQTANQKLADMFGYGTDELKGLPLNTLISDTHKSLHPTLVRRYIASGIDNRPMASGRIVSGTTKGGKSIDVKIDLSVNKIDGETFVFASISDESENKALSSRLQEDFSRLNRIIDASEDGIWEWNLQTDEVWYSPRLMKMLGRDPLFDTPKIEHWLSHIHPEDKTLVEAHLESHLKHNKDYDVIYRGKHIDGGYHWVHARAKTIYDENQSPLLMSGILTDINERRLLELELDKETKFREVVLNKSLAGIYIFDLVNQTNNFINSQYTQITGYSLQELNEIQKDPDLMGLFHPDDLPHVEKHIHKVITNPLKNAQLEYRFRHKDGHWIWCLSMDSVYEIDSQGNPLTMLGSFVDITELKYREAKIENLAHDFINTFEQAAVGIAHVGLDGSWIKVNRKLCKILKYSRDTLLQKTFQDITYPDDLSADIEHVNRLISGKETFYSMEKRYVCGNGKIIWANLTVSMVKDHNQKNSHFISVIEDITRRKNIEQALEESNRALEKFAYSASHDLQEPLRKIEGFSQRLTKRIQSSIDDDNALFELDRISDAANRMRQMIDSLLELSRLTKEPLNKEDCPLSVLVNAVLADISTLLVESNADVVCKRDAILHVDKFNFTRVLTNLIINSIRYAKPNNSPNIVIDTYNNDSQILITITDNGMGFDQDKAELIFEPFKRLVGRTYQGHGMGLPIVKQIINAHKGKIVARSTKGVGSVFEISLPV
ncbi:MAG: PAS domain S-box protein [Pseudomonadales bacterium]|nr:PAS domain S-box protein [Pseudomonadales bacterium]